MYLPTTDGVSTILVLRTFINLVLTKYISFGGKFKDGRMKQFVFMQDLDIGLGTLVVQM